MAITPGQIVRADDFISTSSGASDSGKIPKLNALGQVAPGFQESPFYGDGSDGNVTISSPTTLTRTMYYNNLTVDSTLNTGGFMIFVKGILTGNGSGNIVGIPGADGSNGSSGAGTGSGGAGGAAGAVTPGVWSAGAGEDGTTAGAGTATPASGGIGGVGGDGGAGQQDNIYGGGDRGRGLTGTGGPLTYGVKPGANVLSLNGIDITLSGLGLYTAGGGGGGGGGGANAVHSGGGSQGSGGGGGGGGSGGGMIWIAAREWAGTFAITSVGGDGGAGANYISGYYYLGSGGGGGGGGGGAAIILYGSKTWTGSYALTGGTGGAAGTGATAGSNGGTGVAYEILAH